MQHRILYPLLVLFTTVSSAQEDLLACVDREVREGLLPHETIAPPMSCAVPDELAGLEPPADLVFFGSTEGLYRRIAMYRSALAPGEAVDAVTVALHDAGWRDLEMDALTVSGFVADGQPLRRQLCRDSSRLYVLAHSIGETTEVRLLVATNPRAASCDALLGDDRRVNDERGDGSALQDYLPRLTLPGERANAI